ncbi:Uncharacterised protein [uncultured archaeon]|nr:Uncharacterised protein [uncultured archaeon]
MVGRVLDEDFEGEMKKKAMMAADMAKSDVMMAEKFAVAKKEKFEEMVKEHPLAFVMGAFVGGIVVGALISKRG